MRFVEVLGKVADSGESIREFTAIDLGDGVGECRPRGRAYTKDYELRSSSYPPRSQT